ncbi:MAG TPA: thiamine pyrophosphate-dependent enzyme [Actinomycetes bacterium]|nr:thiamine pyrophosphate-dependent enzyme [Actinomycetes bacterium]
MGRSGPPAATPLGAGLTPERALELFDSQLGSRHLDLAARWLRAQGKGFYTIGSSGHEGNAAVAAALRPTDPALLHYRSGAFYVERARQVGGVDPLRDVLLGVVAAASEPIAGGRHKVFGRRELAVIPQTSTIASHLPRAVGVAFAIERATRLGVACDWPADAVTVCSFGDASVNHSTAAGAINAAIQVGFRGLPLPLLLVCEDNGLGISVPTPAGWVEHAYGARPGLRYFVADGCDLVDAVGTAAEAAAWVREHRRPAFLHLRTVRLMAHAGSDVETAYRRPQAIAADLKRDPLLRTVEILTAAGVLTPDEALARYEAKRARVLAIAREVADLPPLDSAAAVMAPLALPPEDVVRRTATAVARPGRRAALIGTPLPEHEPPLTLAQSINRALLDVLVTHPGTVVFGEDVAAKGGVYGVTRGLAKRVGTARVFDTLLDEQTILGLALGAGLSGLLPIPEIQYLAYLHNAADQLRGEAATLRFFSQGQYRNPMVVRIAGYGYQKGFGGHFHNDNAIAALRDIPGLVIASPARPDDAAAMLRTCVGAALADGAVCVYLEPIALYHARDLYAEGDGGWLAPYVGPAQWAGEHVPIGRARTYGDGGDLTLVSYANGLFMSLRVAARLEAAGLRCRVVDLRWLAPLPVQDLLREAEATGTVLVVDETRRSGGVAEGVLAALVDAGFAGSMARVTSRDSVIPLGDAALHVLVSEADIERAARRLLGDALGA